MATIKYKPTTPSRRNMSSPSFDEVTKFSPVLVHAVEECDRS